MLPHPQGRLIRLAAAGDVEGIAAVHAKGWQAAYRGIVPEPTLQTVTVESRSRVWAEARLGARPRERPVFVAELDGAIIGMAAFGPPRDAAPPCDTELYALYVDPLHWGEGTGRSLFTHGVRDLAERGCRGLYLWVFAANQPARSFYKRLGGTPLEDRVRPLDMDGIPVPELPYAWSALPTALLG